MIYLCIFLNTVLKKILTPDKSPKRPIVQKDKSTIKTSGLYENDWIQLNWWKNINDLVPPQNVHGNPKYSTDAHCEGGSKYTIIKLAKIKEGRYWNHTLLIMVFKIYNVNLNELKRIPGHIFPPKDLSW